MGELEKSNECQCSWISAAKLVGMKEMKPETRAIVRSGKVLSFLSREQWEDTEG